MLFNQIKRYSVFLSILAFFSFALCSITFAQDDTAYIRKVRSMETDELGIVNPAGISFSNTTNTFFVVNSGDKTQNATDILMFTPTEELIGHGRITGRLNNPINMTFDNKAKRLLIFNSITEQLINVNTRPNGSLDSGRMNFQKFVQVGLINSQGMTVDP